MFRCSALSLVLGVFVIWAVGSAAITDAHASTVLLEDSFDSYATGSQPVPPWTWTPFGPDVDVSIDDTVYISGKSAHFLDTTGSAGGVLSQPFPAATYVVLEYYM